MVTVVTLAGVPRETTALVLSASLRLLARLSLVSDPQLQYKYNIWAKVSVQKRTK